MRKYVIGIIVYLFTIAVSYSQPVMISGVVTEKSSGEPLPGVLVTIRSKENKIVKFNRTSVEGRYEISFESFPAEHTLHFSLMNFAAQSVTLETNRQVYDVQLSEQATELKEVIVKAPGIHQRGDTIRYVVSSFADARDKSLADVLKKMPGIEVEKSGEIKFNGVSINKFYIEGKDLLGGRYGLATQNVQQQDVGSVEVMENHQPLKALEDISFSQNPAINIRLKEDAKARWVGTVKAGAGLSPFLWNIELALMRFKKNAQTLNTYKTNNTGEDLIRETQSFSIDEILSQFSKNYRLADNVNVSPGSLAELDAERTRFNKTHMMSTNNLWSLGKNYDLTSQITYTNTRLTSDNSSVTAYFLQDSILTEEKTEHGYNRQNRLSGDVTLSANTSSYYFKNKLSTDLRWNDTDIDIAGTYSNRQSASLTYRSIANDLELLKRTGKQAYTIHSFNLYQTKPQDLTVTRDGEAQEQQVLSSAFYTNTNTSLAFYLKPFTVSLKLGIIGVARSLESTLTGVSDTIGRLDNDLSVRYLNLYASPEVEYKNGGFEAKFDMPVSFLSYQYRNRLTEEKEPTSRFLLSPGLYMRYHVTSRLSASVSGRLSQSPVEEQSFYEGVILQNYRSLARGLIDYETGTQKSLTLSTSYKNPLKAFFANASVMRSWSYSPRISDRSFIDDFILYTYISQPHYSDVWMLNGNVSKGIDAIRGMVSVRSSYLFSGASMFQNGIETPYSSDLWTVSPKINSRFSDWGGFVYELEFSRNRLSLTNSETESSYTNLSQKLTCHITPFKTWSLELVGEHYYNEITADVSKHFFLSDAAFTYSFRGGWELNLSVTNIFNQRIYAYTLFDGLTSMVREYRIRPRNFLASVFFRF